MFVLGIALAVGYGRGRAVFALLVLATAYASRQWWLQEGLDGFHARAVYAALTIYVPIDLALLSVLPERGVLNRHGALRIGVLLAQVAFTAWVFIAGRVDFVDLAHQKFLVPAPFSAGRLPQAAMLAVALSFLVATLAAFVSRSHLNASIPNAYVTFASFIAAAELMVVIAVLQDTFRMAFRDELTGIPSRRALNEQLAALGSRYTIAMVDVDHFKSFNDTYGHDLGDQALRFVAAHIARVGGGGKAFRYGGEEFTVLFPGKYAEDAIPFLEGVREDIESYRMALRGSDRPARTRGSKRQRGGWRGKKVVSVTVSIGVAERNGRRGTPQAVIEAADRALYRAKEKGRNRLSR
jgi:diguanylate cyclase (GGDEF)-like protein